MEKCATENKIVTELYKKRKPLQFPHTKEIAAFCLVDLPDNDWHFVIAVYASILRIETLLHHSQVNMCLGFPLGAEKPSFNPLNAETLYRLAFLIIKRI